MIKDKLLQLYKENDNKLPLGMYTIHFIDEDCNIYCYDCANKLIDDEYVTLVDTFIHWEGESMYCESCNVEIESEYGEIEEDIE